MPASGKTTVARLLAAKLGVRSMNAGDVLKDIASEKGYRVTGADWWDTPEGMRFLGERAANPEFDREADRRVLGLIEGGDVVVTSYVMPWLAKMGTKCWLEASLEVRASRLAARDGIAQEEARRITAARDRENRDLYKKHYGIELGTDMKPFNIVLDVNNMTPERAADAVLELIGAGKRGV
jgi:cytidylate kinase